MKSSYRRAWDLGAQSKHPFGVITALGYGVMMLGAAILTRTESGKEILEFLVCETHANMHPQAHFGVEPFNYHPSN